MNDEDEDMYPSESEDIYPSEAQLTSIAEWSSDDLRGLFEYIAELWYYPDRATRADRTWTLITGGWSGNESLIAALGENNVAWLLTWQESHRGGRHVFEIPKYQTRAE